MNDFTLLGVDPGLRHTGYGLIRVQGARLSALTWGVITPKVLDNPAYPSNDKPLISSTPLAHRLGQIFTGLTDIIEQHRPDCAAIEIVFVNVNPQSTLLLGQARGAAITALVQKNLPVHELTALQVKQGVVGYGRASKMQIRFMVKTLLGIPDDAAMSMDAADALACALSASFQMRAAPHRLAIKAPPHVVPSAHPSGSVLEQYQAQSARRRKSNRWKALPSGSGAFKG